MKRYSLLIQLVIYVFIMILAFGNCRWDLLSD